MKNSSTPIAAEEMCYFIAQDYITPQRLAVHRIGRVFIQGRRVYVPQLSLILRTNNIPVHNQNTQTKELINGTIFQDSYIKGFDEGIAYFEKHFAVSPNVIYGIGKDDYVRDLHGNFFHQHEQNGNFGWDYWLNSYPEVLSHAEINRYGFYAGLVSELKKLMLRHSAVFKDFELCVDHAEKTKWHYTDPAPKGKSKPSPPEQVSFVLEKDALPSDAVNDVMNILIKGGLIHPHTKLPDFRKVFAGVVIEKQIEWTSSLASLAYFVSKVWVHRERGKSKWSAAVHCFSHKLNPIPQSLKNNKTVGKGDKAIIDNAMKHFGSTRKRK